MSETEIASVRALLQSLPRPKSLAERRERLDTVASADGYASDIAFEPVRIGPCPAEWSLAPGSDRVSISGALTDRELRARSLRATSEACE
jgi:hypothetical protein